MSDIDENLKKLADQAGKKTRQQSEENTTSDASGGGAAAAFSSVFLLGLVLAGLLGGIVLFGDRQTATPPPTEEVERRGEEDEDYILSDGRLPQETLEVYSDLEKTFRGRTQQIEETLRVQKDNLACATAVAIREEVEAKADQNGTTDQIETMAIINDLILQIKMMNRYRATINPTGNRQSAPTQAVKEVAGEIYTIAYQQYKKADALDSWNNNVQQAIAYELAEQMLRKSDRQMLNDLIANLDAAIRLLKLVHAGTTPTNPNKTQIAPNCRVDITLLEGQLQLVSEDAETLYALIPEVQQAYRNITRGRTQPPSPTEAGDITFPFPVRATVGGE